MSSWKWTPRPNAHTYCGVTYLARSIWVACSGCASNNGVQQEDVAGGKLAAASAEVGVDVGSSIASDGRRCRRLT
ncbi:uncharacterized protein Dana_GF24892, isoform C [Drosophila ananassae]|uniref:Uncharacterized protein, isoform C n=1 Tax=Drosophila ananassae TaxID=7217 RepID=A0A0P8XSG8_DROAN|nr:uncharacterized protein Dana_GF24892, isoform C [Drosophila ananassae]